MFKQKYSLEVKGAEDRNYVLLAEPNSPLGELYDALHVMRAHVLNKMNEQEAEEKKDKSQESPEEEAEPKDS